MANNTYTVTLPDGSTDSRKSPRPYTHAVIVVETEESLKVALARDARYRDDAAKVVAELEVLASAPGAAEEYAAAKAAVDYLNEKVTEIKGGAEVQVDRWLSREYRASLGDPEDKDWRSLREHRKICDRMFASPIFKLTSARETLARWEAAEARTREYHKPGRAWVYGWSMSSTNAGKMGDKARNHNPGARVIVTSDIAVRTPKPRTKKTS